jgi:acyl-CoA synthetase (AMP-forming)/AMP-acid ligase II
VFIIRLAAKPPFRRGPLSSNVRPHTTVIERYSRPLNQSERRRIQAELARIAREVGARRAATEAAQLAGAALVAGLGYSYFSGTSVAFSVLGCLAVGAVLLVITRFERWQQGSRRRRSLQQALKAAQARVVHVTAESYAEFNEFEDLGAMYAFQIDPASLLVLRGQEYYETEYFPSLDFELITVPGAFFIIRSHQAKASPAVAYAASEMLSLSAIEDEAVIPGTVANALVSCEMRPNPSLERTSTGKPLGPRGAQAYAAPRGPSAFPAGSAQLKR